jgi:hypothetical protein
MDNKEPYPKEIYSDINKRYSILMKIIHNIKLTTKNIIKAIHAHKSFIYIGSGKNRTLFSSLELIYAPVD